MAIAFVATATTTGSVVSSVAATVPTHSEGDVLIARASINFGLNRTFGTAPSGWTALGGEGTDGNMRTQAYYKVASASEPSTYTFSASGVTKWRVQMYSYSGVDTASVLDVAGSYNNGSGSTATATSITTNNDNSLVLHWSMCRDLATFTQSASPSFTERADDGSSPGDDTSMSLGDYTQATAGAVGSVSSTLSTGRNWLSIMIAINEEAASTPAPLPYLAQM